MFLVTLHFHFLPQTDNAVVLKNNEVAWNGPTADLLANTELRQQVIGESIGEDPDEAQQTHALDHGNDSAEVEPAEAVPVTALIDEEERADGAVKSSVLKFYAKAAGGIIASVGVGAMALILTGFKIVTNYWLVWWIEMSLGLSQSQYIGIYLGINAALSVMMGMTPLLRGGCSRQADLSASIVRLRPDPREYTCEQDSPQHYYRQNSRCSIGVLSTPAYRQDSEPPL